MTTQVRERGKDDQQLWLVESNKTMTSNDKKDDVGDTRKRSCLLPNNVCQRFNSPGFQRYTE